MAKELNLEVLEMNASDTRNKKSIEELVKTLSTNTSLDYFKQNARHSSDKKSVIIMDEIDGMSGSD